MDLNYLFHRQQVERSRARAADSKPARQAHEELAQRYEEEIERLTAESFSIRAGDEADGGAENKADTLPAHGDSRFNKFVSKETADR